MPEEIITVSNVSKVFHQNSESSFGKIAWSYFCEYILNRKKFATDKNNFYALKDIHFSLKKGESMGIIGLNGSGKSTLLQLLAGTMRPTTGKITVRGKVAALLELGSGFNPQFTGKENIYLNATLLGLEKSYISENFHKIVSFADIGDFIDQPVFTYSSGMRLRLAFAIIVYAKPEILVIDEVIAVGDAAFTQKCFRFLRSFQKEGTLIFVSHDLESIKLLCERSIWMEAGNLLLDSTPKNVINKYLEHVMGSSSLINKLTRSNFNTSKSPAFNEFGFGKANIVSCGLYHGDTSTEISNVNGEELVILKVEAEILKTFEHPVFGFILHNRIGYEVIAFNTDSVSQTPQIAKKGQIISCSMKFRLPILIGGKYSMSVAISEKNEDEYKIQHWIHDRINLFYSKDKNYMGMVGIKIKDVIISSHALEII